jgi:hypothetical protein
MTYTIPKPSYPLFLKLLVGLVVTGLLGLGIVAFETFSLVHGPVVAAIFAIVIEVGAAIDSIGLAGGINKRSWWLVPAILITIIVSGWYNYATVAQHGAAFGLESAHLDLILHAIAWGPLASLSFMALGVGFRIADHERAVDAWKVNRQAWLDAQAAKTAQAQTDQETRHMQFEYQKAKLQADKEIEIARVQAEQDRKVQVAQARIEARKDAQKPSAIAQELHTVAQGTYEDFVQAISSNGKHEWTGEMIAQEFGVSRRTGNYWLSRWRREHAEPVTTTQN